VNEALPENIQRFISSYISSVEQLEVLLLLSDSPDRFWSTKDVFQAIQSNESSITERLHGLALNGFLELESAATRRYRFNPSSKELAQNVAELKQTYAVRRVKVIGAIFAKPPDRIRSFADAFKLRKD
jgi:hypothetical protein